jgi:hypothetical protein
MEALPWGWEAFWRSRMPLPPVSGSETGEEVSAMVRWTKAWAVVAAGLLVILALPVAGQHVKTTYSSLDNLAFSKPELRVVAQSVTVDSLRQEISSSEER